MEASLWITMAGVKISSAGVVLPLLRVVRLWSPRYSKAGGVARYGAYQMCPRSLGKTRCVNFELITYGIIKMKGSILIPVIARDIYFIEVLFLVAN